LAFLLALGLAHLAPASAQESGKVQGRVTDAASGQPIVGAQVSVAGTRLGNITNAEGFYFINNVPAGLHNLNAQFIGYQAVTVSQQRVLAGQTVTVDFKLTQSAVQIAALEIIGETHPLVPRDQVGSKNIVTGQTISDLPVDDVRQIIMGQPGVVANVGKGLSIRGGRSGEEAVYIDGVLIRNFNMGDSNLEVGVNSLSEVDVLTGGFSAEYGEAQSGIINYVTRSSGARWNGAFGYQTDELMPKQWSYGLNRFEASLGGPIFGNLGLFVAGTAEGRRFSNAGKGWRDVPLYMATGVDTVVNFETETGDTREVIVPNFVKYDEGGRLPFSNSDEATLDAKLDFTYGSGSRVFLSSKFSRNQNRTAFGGGLDDLYNPTGYTGNRANSRAFILGWTHNFVQSAERALALDVKLAMTRDEGLGGVLDREWEVDNREPFMGFTMSTMKFVVNEEDFPVDKARVDAFLRNTDVKDEAGNCIRCRTPFDITRTDLQHSQEFRLNPYGAFSSSFWTGGLAGTFNYNREEQLQARATVDWQVNRHNRLKFGGEWIDIDTRVASVGYQSLSFAQFWVEQPKRQGLFVLDRLDLGDLVIEGGVRYDRFDPNAEFPVTPGYFNLEDPTSFAKAPVRSTISPRLGVSFPVTVNSTFRLNYGHFTQLPDLNEYYYGKNTDYFRFGNTNTNDRFARPADIGKTIAFEFGYRQLLGPDFVLDISAYNRDKTKDVTYRKLAWFDPTYDGAGQAPQEYLNTLTNADFGNIRGIDLRLDRRFGRLLDVMLGYSYQDARNTGTDPLTFTRLFARIEGNANQLLGLPPNPAQSIRQTEENRDHNLTGNFSLHFPSNYEKTWLQNVGLYGTFRFISGLPYSPVTDVGQALVTGPPTDIFAGELRDDEISTARMPWQKAFDLKAQKGLRLMGWNANVFIDARNVLDLTNTTGVFLTTGDITDDAAFDVRVASHRQTLGGGSTQDRIDLSSLDDAGAGVRNEVDLVALRRAERLFGNGDGIFDGAEQIRAFRAAEQALNGSQFLLGQGRRVRLGFELTF
jgi:hypothetical protein